MALPNQPESWQFDPNDSYVPINYEGEMMGFGKPEFAIRVVDLLNDEEKFRKALRLACYDLVSRLGGLSSSLDELVESYLAKAQTPRSGIGAIALLLQHRQMELDVNDEEFARFCDSYRLSRNDLQGIYDGKEVDVKILTPLSRILGMSVDSLLEVLEGTAHY